MQYLSTCLLDKDIKDQTSCIHYVYQLIVINSHAKNNHVKRIIF
jgi:hypothetical protein